MNSDKRQQLEKTYNALINVALQNHPISEISDHINADIMGYGSALDEKLHGWEGVKWMIERQRQELNNQKSTIRRYPVESVIFSNDTAALKVEEIEITVDMGDEPHGFTIRLSTLLEYTGVKWMVRHFHGSTADADTPEGNAWPIEEWKRRNAELQRAVDEKTAELQYRNRELEIEAALERVRSRAMAMHNSYELGDLIITIFRELQKLDMQLTRCLLWVFNAEDKSATAWMTNSEYPNQADDYHIPYHDHHAYISFLRGWETSQQYWEYDLSGELKVSWDEILVYGYLDKLPEYIKEAMKEPERVILSGSFNKYGIIQTAGLDHLSKANHEILQRFSQVFEQTYTRFLDLNKAEAQAREAQIEAALEKVRSRSLAMHKSDELKDVVAVVFEKLMELDFELEKGAAIILIFIKGSKDHLEWIADPTQAYVQCIRFPYYENPLVADILNGWEMGTDYYSREYSFTVKNDFFRYAFEHTDYKHIPDERKEVLMKAEKYSYSIAFEKKSAIGVPDATGKIFSNEKKDILKRFAHVFDQAYTRFLDLQKAEAQAREAQIELAMERVRARSMAMHRSEELSEVVALLFEEIKPFGFASSGIELILPDEHNDVLRFWSTSTVQNKFAECFNISRTIHPFFQKTWKAWKDQLPRLLLTLEGEEKKKFDQLILTETDFKRLPEEVKQFILNSGYQDVFSSAIMKHGLLESVDTEPISEEQFVILERFAKVFEQTYTRFLDLQKAEAQAREAQIEAALERVRAQTMAMHNSEDVGKCTVKMFSEVTALGVDEGTRFGIGILNHDNEKNQLWTASKEGKQVKMHKGHIDMNWHPLLQSARKAWKEQVPVHRYVLEGEDLQNYYQVLNSAPDYPISIPIEKLPERQFHYGFVFEHGFFYAFSPSEFQPDLIRILQRFSSLFGQTYTRFLDLQKAESQAREAQINLAVERVRARALAMFKSEEILEVVFKLKEEIMGLDISGVAAATILLKEDNGMYRNWDLTSMEQEGESMHLPLDISFDLYKTHPEFYLRKVWSEGIKYTVVTQDLKSLQITTNWLRDNDKIKEANEADHFIKTTGVQQVFHPTIPLNNGRMCIDLLETPTDEIESILLKMGSAFDLAYKRFEDLQKAEAQAKEAKIEASLERVRSRALAMRSADELEQVTHILREEMGLLDQRELESAAIHLYPDGTDDVLWWGAFQIPGRGDGLTHIGGNISRHSVKLLSEFYGHYAKGEREYTMAVDLSMPEMAEWMSMLAREVPEILDALDGEVPEQAWWNGAAFSGGAIITLTYVPPTEELLDLQRRVANAFDIAYRRFIDLQKAHAETQRVLAERDRAETALKELRATQAQLIQSEKLASLGELTAGIAHEIQNPLNFVNNFSEVSNELIDEMKVEFEKGDKEEALAIADDIKQNLEKINYHGKRADAIVKGMLQHSRISTGQKEPTDLNALADEYLRLAYHGLRAKDCTFNAEFTTQLDPDLPKVNVIPQDMGRVLLNLINNAFQAVHEKRMNRLKADEGPEDLKMNEPQSGRVADDEYSPMVTVSTKQINDKVEITVSDNGPGIPDSIKDKIFQPFFTTKPTGQGTGLGLSLSYDIIKAHGGEIKVNSLTGAGTEVILYIPVSILSI